MVQTDLHILPPSIDKNYSSNLWELRNRALHLVSTVNKQYKAEGKISFSSFQATISRCTTRSTQTYKSNFRYGIYVQAAPPRNKEVQTRRDNYMNTKKLLTYIFGLRGRRDDNQHVLSFLEDELEHLQICIQFYISLKDELDRIVRGHLRQNEATKGTLKKNESNIF